MDTRLYLEINRLARETSWAHGMARALAGWAGVGTLAAVVLLAFLRARSGVTGGGPREVAAALWAAGGAAAAYGIDQPVAHLLGRTPPFELHRGALVLLPGAYGAVLPDDRAVVAGAALLGCFLARDLLLGALAALAGLLLAFDRVYAGLRTPGQVLAGLCFGAVAVVVGYPAVLGLEGLVRALLRTPLGLLVGPAGRRHRQRRPASSEQASRQWPGRGGEAGPAARPPVLAATGAVRLLGDRPISPRGSRPGAAGGGEARDMAGS